MLLNRDHDKVAIANLTKAVVKLERELRIYLELALLNNALVQNETQ